MPIGWPIMLPIVIFLFIGESIIISLDNEKYKKMKRDAQDPDKAVDAEEVFERLSLRDHLKDMMGPPVDIKDEDILI